ncbi:MAG: hypothetical protein IJI54_11170 [Kiritimatiellae bacterium]|nr:hypothetical protein [Kiritimatiellia bacterium]
MKYVRLAISAALACAATATAQAELPPWRTPKVNSINRLPARAVAVPCESSHLAMLIAKGEKVRTDSRWIFSLNGTWDFKWKHTVDAPKWEKSAKIEVPGCWQLQGDYDPALYTNVTFPIKDIGNGDPMAEPPKDYTSHYYRNPVGLYSRTFRLPPSWSNRRTVIHFGGVSSAMYVRLNGKEIGYSEDSRLPAEFDLTPHLRSGENSLEVEVLKHCDGTFLEDQDFWRLSGIFRDVWLVSEGIDSPKDLVIEATLSDDYKKGRLVVRDENGKAVMEKTYDDPKLWSCEAPNLYYEVLDTGDDYRAIVFGFRKVEIRDSVIYINGKRAVFKGTDRHEMQPEGGYTVTLEGMKRDIEIFHELNINAVRTCHYPNDPTWYELCDREGIYVVCEANIESHGAGFGKDSYAKKPAFLDSHVERGVNMVKTFRNHPSIVIWSMGNEAGDGPNFAAEYKAMKAVDGTRPVQYEGAQDSDHSDVKCPMYTRPWNVEKYVRNNPKKPFVLCEYTHAMGNSNGGIQKYWDLVWKYPSMQGGFIWDFVDQAVWKTDATGTWLAYGGDFDDWPNDDNFNCNGIVAADRTFHPGAYEIKHAYQPIIVKSWDWETSTAVVFNNYRFTPLDGIVGIWKMEKDGAVLATGHLDLSEFGPDSERRMKLFVPDGDNIMFAFWKPGEKRTQAHDQFVKPFKPVAAPVGVEGAVAGAFRVNLWRAPTDNDRGWKMDRVCRVWRDATISQQMPEGVETELKVSTAGFGKKLVSFRLEVKNDKLPPIPRVGVTFKIPTDFRTVKWYGLGPWENYSDRATAAILGGHTAGIGVSSGLAGRRGKIDYVLDALNPDNYIEPGEQGYRTGCRWVEFSSAAGRTVRVTALNAPFCFNAWPYSQESLENARHQWDLSDEGEITVNIDVIQMGVGGDNSWGNRPHDEFMPGKGKYELQFLLEGI